MSTELDRAEAKGAIVKRESDDPDLDAALSGAHQYQLGLAKEQNRHMEEMRGWFGRVFGHGDNVPTYIAATAMVAGIIITAGCLVAAAHFEQSVAEFWAKQAERAFAFSGTCLAFIFGKGLSASQK